jgi:surfeit locus 1 family protein
MQLKIKYWPTKHWTFKPHLGLTVLVIFLLPILLGLSYWQWQRGLSKDALLATYQQNQHARSIVFQGKNSLPLAAFQPLTVTGTLDMQHQFYVDNQIYAGRAGFEVIIPLQLNNGEWLLVNLGWLPRHTQRLELPTFPKQLSKEITITGRADFPSHQYLLLGTYLEKNQDNKFIIQAIDFDKLSEFLGVSLLPIVVLLDPQPATPFIRDWQPPTTMPPEKHYGYALQWLFLAITLCILYGVFCLKR